METLEEVTPASADKDLSQIVKGKRTKRQRPQSPIPFTIATHSSSGDGSINVDCIDNNANYIASSNCSDDEYFLGTITEEDEDMAKCLILLARGRHNSGEPTNKIDQEHEFGADNNFTSKRYVETPGSANGKATGVYVYECKTCGRTFPSFQALGGHRASHKKPKNMAAEEKKLSLLLSSDEEEEPIEFKDKNNKRRRMPSQLTLELGSRGMYSSFNTDNCKSSTPKVHECSYCGAEFTSGQALGGHMRRHRGAAPALSPRANLSLSALSLASMDQESDQEADARRPTINLSLDLNLPAPEDDHNRDSKFALVKKQQPQQQQQQQSEEEKQTALVLSTRSLIECHY